MAATGSEAKTGGDGLASVTARQWLILLMVQLATLLFGMTITIVNVVLPQIRGTLSATQDQIAWVVTFHIVAIAVGTPMTGWLASRLGWRTLMAASLGGFTTFSMLCGLASSLEMLVVFRVGQGLTGAPIFPMSQAVLLATFPRHLQPPIMMLWGIGSVLGPVLGPILGSVVADAYSWRAAFYLIVLPGIGATICAWIALAAHTERSEKTFDWTGFIALSLAIAAAQLMMDRGQRLDWFESPEIWIEAAVVVLGLWVFVVHSLTAEKPFLDPRMLLDRNFALGLAVAFVMGMLMFTPLVLFPGLLHDLKGYPDVAIGTILASRGVGNWLSFLIVVPFTRWHPRLAVAVGLGAQALAGWAMAQLDLNLTAFDVVWTNILQGFGFGLAFTPMTVLAFATLPKHFMTEGSAVFNLVRNFGSSLFISASVVLLVRSTAASYGALTEGISPFNRALDYAGVLGQWSTASPGGLMALAGEIQRQAAMIGYINAFYMFATTALLAIPLAFMMRDVPRTT